MNRFFKMIDSSFLKLVYLLLLLYVSVNEIHAQITLPNLVGDSMVLQRNQKVKIWGWASPVEVVTVKFNKKSYVTTTSSNKEWFIILPSMKAGGPYEMIIKGSNEKIIKGILIGEIWLCSGQSNMELQMNRVGIIDRYASDIEASGNYQIRHFLVEKKYSLTPLQDVSGSWKPANPINVLNFTAAGYFFAKKLYDKYKVPIGLIHSSWGGTPIESWMSSGGLKNFPEDINKVNYYTESGNLNKALLLNKQIDGQWFNELSNKDKGLLKNGGDWAINDMDSHLWGTVNFPGYWDSQKGGPGNIDGVVWVKKVIDINESMIQNGAYLDLGRIDDIDSTYFNGTFIGSLNSKHQVRRYDIPKKLIKQGRNVITIRIVDKEGTGGLIPGKLYQFVSGNQVIPLAGSWQYKLGASMSGFPAKNIVNIASLPTVLGNGMINPLLNYTIKGILWYQGEANVNDVTKYAKLLPNMISDWRDKWAIHNIPFLIVQLPNYMKVRELPEESNWASLREVQAKVAIETPNCGLAITIDIGDADDIHPDNKKDVGYLLALVAQKLAYNEKNIISMGPVFKSSEIKDDKIILSFDNLGKGLVVKNGGDLKQFAIAGSDYKFFWATAKIEGNKVIVFNAEVKNPVAVRYAWADNPNGANLYNAQGLPAMPFRTDREQ